MREIGIVGSGPMAIYLLKHLATSDEPLAITLFEASPSTGTGMPYDAELNADYMLCNAFSREIPALDRPLIDWLKDRPSRELNEWELSAHDLTARAFYPRVLIGEYLRSQFTDLCEYARASGHQITVLAESRVEDITVAEKAKATIHYKRDQSFQTALFDDVVIATGHCWPDVPEIDGVTMVSPWPYTNITALAQDNIGVLGSSLSAIDTVVAISHARGQFEETGDRISWLPSGRDSDLRITMVSQLGIMPEGDFYYPFPYEPLTCITAEAIGDEIALGSNGLLDRVFKLLCDELDAADPAYLDGLPETARSVEGFAPAYFSRRREISGLRAVKRDLVEARETLQRKETLAYRYALLRGHGVFDLVLRDLSQKDYARFLNYLMPVFADCYAAVPHLSLARIVALYDAGVLELCATEEGAKFSQLGEGRIEVDTEDGTIGFDVLIDARGQTPASLTDLPFPQLVEAIITPDEPLLQPFMLNLGSRIESRIFCLAMPQLLEHYPFSQGLAECAQHARQVADEILSSQNCGLLEFI